MRLKNKVFLSIADIIVVSMMIFLIVTFVDLSNPVRLSTFIIMVLTLLIPGIMPFTFKEVDSPASILTFILFVGNLVATIILFSIPVTEAKPLIITETIIFGLYLAFIFVALGSENYDKKHSKKSISN